MSGDKDKPDGPALSAKGEKKAQEKYQRQAEALRANLRRRHEQRRGQEDEAPVDKDGGTE